MTNNLIWFRNDLRIHDNTALAAITSNATQVSAIFIVPIDQWLSHDLGQNKIGFILRQLFNLEQHLNKLNINLHVIECDNFAQIPNLLAMYCTQQNISSVYCNLEYEFNEQQRDQKVKVMLNNNSINFYTYHDQIIIPPETIKTNNGGIYTVFTPYKRKFITIINEYNLTPWKIHKMDQNFILKRFTLSAKLINYLNSDIQKLWPIGEKHANYLLNNFIKHNLNDYKEHRDYPQLNNTSKLSPYLSIGILSPRTCMLKAMQAPQNESTAVWINELIWREFYKYVLYHNQRISRNQNYNTIYNNIIWNKPDEKLIAWQCGKTGYPLIDAAMRQLIQTGWMHNRLRMITAMFFSKNLFFDWRIGEKFFAKHLIDLDFASNNGGWQWSASTGTDAVPYFRIFNPITQSIKFDPDGTFIKQFCPELKSLDNKAIHLSANYLSTQQLNNIGYMQPIVDLRQSRNYAIEMFKKCK